MFYVFLKEPLGRYLQVITYILYIYVNTQQLPLRGSVAFVAQRQNKVLRLPVCPKGASQSSFEHLTACPPDALIFGATQRAPYPLVGAHLLQLLQLTPKKKGGGRGVYRTPALCYVSLIVGKTRSCTTHQGVNERKDGHSPRDPPPGEPYGLAFGLQS